MVIRPEVFTTPDCPTVKIREGFDKVDLKAELNRVLRSQGWGLGTYFYVQFTNHDRTMLLRSGFFVVTEEKETVHTFDSNIDQTITKAIVKRSIQQIGEWCLIEDEETLTEVKPEEKRGRGRPPKAAIVN